MYIVFYMKTNAERDKQIAALVLGGKNLPEVAREYDITKNRVRQIVFKHCRKSNKEFYRLLCGQITTEIGTPKPYHVGVNLEQLRKHKLAFVNYCDA
jgi:hypothetical protein